MPAWPELPPGLGSREHRHERPEPPTPAGPRLQGLRLEPSIRAATRMTRSRTRVSTLTWWPSRNSSAKRAARSRGAASPGGPTQCPPARAVGAASLSASCTGCEAERGRTPAATSACGGSPKLSSRSIAPRRHLRIARSSGLPRHRLVPQPQGFEGFGAVARSGPYGRSSRCGACA